MKKRRPAGVMIFSSLYVFLGVLFILKIPLFSILYLISGLGVFFLKPFSRYLAIAISVMSIIFNTAWLVVLFRAGVKINAGPLLINSPVLIINMILFYLFNFGAIYYFTRYKVKEQFK